MRAPDASADASAGTSDAAERDLTAPVRKRRRRPFETLYPARHRTAAARSIRPRRRNEKGRSRTFHAWYALCFVSAASPGSHEIETFSIRAEDQPKNWRECYVTRRHDPIRTELGTKGGFDRPRQEGECRSSPKSAALHRLQPETPRLGYHLRRRWHRVA